VHCGMESFVFSFPVYVDHAFRVSWSGPSELVVPDVAVAERQLKEADEAYDQNPCDRTLVERNRFSAELVQVLAQEETFWRQKADPTAIKDSAASFFQRLLTAEPVFPKEMDIFSIDPDSVASPDGFGAVFFHTCWEIVFEDVFDTVIKFFHGVEMSKGFTATTISLIPKTASPTCWSEYQSISLCNVTNKICTKLTTIRLGRVLPKVLSLSQSGFVPGRLLSDNVLLAQELIYSLESRRPEANVVFKLDMAKAYDRVRFFHSTHDLRQGDPLSPALFVLAADYLMRGLDRLFAAYPTMYYQALGWIRAYERVSGQLINGMKGFFIVGRQVSSLQMQAVQLYSGLFHEAVVAVSKQVILMVVWHRLCRIRNVAEPFLFWTLGEGSVSFWHDNWLREKPLSQLLHKDSYNIEPVSYYYHERDWNVPRILWTVPMPFVQTIRQIPIAAEETVSHLFIDNTAVQGVWQHFAALFGLCLCDTGSLTHMRNAAKYRGIPFSIEGIILEVQLHLRTLYAAWTLTSTQWKGDLHRAATMGFIFRQTIPRAPSIVRWRAPSLSWFKLNTNDSSFGNPGLAGAAGIIRDSAGHVHLAYRVALGTGTSVLAGLYRLAGFGACPDPRSSPLGGGGGCHGGDFTLTVPCFWEVGGTTSDFAYCTPPTVATSGRSTRFQGGEWRS
ncbi:UNVERIFIED_CONTAM: hypothetical protein Scaly_0611500, partial [Sesamum calycinum]